MLRLVFIIMLGIAVITLTYLPYRYAGPVVSTQRATLSIEAIDSMSMMMNRQQPEKRFRLTTEQLHYDEASDRTEFKPFHLVGISGHSFLKADSQVASLQGDAFSLTEHVILQQTAPNKPTRQFTSESLFFNTRTHAIHSPDDIVMTDQEQHIQADSLIGNYEEGWYEFTQHVQSHWQ